MQAGASFNRFVMVLWPGLVALAAFLICLPFVRSLYGLGDEGILLHGAARMARGQALYRDFFELHPPLGFLILRLWSGVAGQGFGPARLLSLLAITGVTVVTAMACVRAGGGKVLATGLSLGWLLMSQGVWTMVNHHWFTTLFSLLALWITLPDRQGSQPRAPLLAGLAVGAAIMTTPPRGVLAGLAVAGHLVSEKGALRRLLMFAVGGAVIPVLCLAYIASQGALAAAAQDLLVFPATQYSGVQAVPWGDRANIQNNLLPWVFPAALGLSGIVIWREGGALLRDERFRACFLFAATGLVGCFPRPDAVHISFAVPLALPLLALCVQRLGGAVRPLYRGVAVATALILSAPCIIAYGYIAGRAISAPLIAPWGVNFPLGLNGEAQLAAELDALPGNAAVFYYPYMPLTPVLARRVGITTFDVYVPGYTTEAQYAQACHDLMRAGQWAVVNVDWTDAKALKLVFPALRDGNPPEKRAFEQALNTGFPRVLRDGAYEFRRRGPLASEALCAAIDR